MYAVPEGSGRTFCTTTMGVMPPASAVKESVAVGEAARRYRGGGDEVGARGSGSRPTLKDPVEPMIVTFEDRCAKRTGSLWQFPQKSMCKVPFKFTAPPDRRISPFAPCSE